MPSGSVSVALLQNRILAEHFQTEVLYPKGLTPLTPTYKRYIGIPKWIFELLRTLINFRGIVYVIDSSRIGLLTVIIQKMFNRRYKTVHYFGQDSPGPTRFRSHFIESIFKHLFNATFVTVLKNADGVIENPVPSLVSYVKNHAKSSVIVPGVLVDTDVVKNSQSSAARIRRQLGLQSRVIVGVVGPFHEWNRSSLDYLRNNLDIFLPDISFLVIGRYNSSDYFSDARVIFAGHVDNFVDYLSTCDCLLIPRLVKFGGPMNKMVYAMAVGLPVVTNDPEGMNITNGINVVISSLDSLPRKVNWLVENPTDRERIGRNARRYVEEFFSKKANETRLATYMYEILRS